MIGLSTNIVRVSRFVDRKFESKRGKGRGRRDILPARITQADGKELFVHPSSGICRQLPDIIDSTGTPNAFIVYHKKVMTYFISWFTIVIIDYSIVE
jgi:hypothetical protein